MVQLIVQKMLYDQAAYSLFYTNSELNYSELN